MARAASKILTQRESEIMQILWRLECATAEQVRVELPDNPHNSSVRTLLRVLTEKGYVKLEARSKPKLYRPAVSQSEVQKTATKSLVQLFFGGSTESLVLRLLEDEQLTTKQIDELRKTLAKSKKKGRKP